MFPCALALSSTQPALHAVYTAIVCTNREERPLVGGSELPDGACWHRRESEDGKGC